ncbi:Uncharacterized protein TCAP_06018 [Tolypocladium capitatum]|uniref:Uncharacterized protein n=1 Tax=Tolypocladium capitatum TaxID=45235 RepID=A0A2K3Q912_9HYPO|nr:Uncharacterized protein TCAP_06018 [Tolypocladium capitatum]
MVVVLIHGQAPSCPIPSGNSLRAPARLPGHGPLPLSAAIASMSPSPAPQPVLARPLLSPRFAPRFAPRFPSGRLPLRPRSCALHGRSALPHRRHNRKHTRYRPTYQALCTRPPLFSSAASACDPTQLAPSAAPGHSCRPHLPPPLIHIPRAAPRHLHLFSRTTFLLPPWGHPSPPTAHRHPTLHPSQKHPRISAISLPHRRSTSPRRSAQHKESRGGPDQTRPEPRATQPNPTQPNTTRRDRDMSSENPPNSAGGGGTGHRRSSITQAALSNLFQRGPSSANGPSFSGPASGALNDPQRRRLSVTTIGLSGASPTTPTAFSMRRESMSTNSDSIDESAVEDEDLPAGGARTAPTTPFVRHMSFGAPAMRGYRPGGSPGNDQQGFNWSEQLRSRAESSVSNARPPFPLASSPPRGQPHHDRAKSVSDMPRPPAQAAAVKPKPESRKPDAFQERILKGDFYMD